MVGYLDETALYINLLCPLKVYYLKMKFSDFKPNIERITIPLICNAFGEKLKAVIIWKSANSKCFKDVDEHNMGKRVNDNWYISPDFGGNQSTDGFKNRKTISLIDNFP